MLNMLISKDKFADIEEAFTRLKGNDSYTHSLGVLSDRLSEILKKRVRVNVVHPTNNTQPCVVMSIFPSEDTINRLVSAIANEEKDSILADVWNGSDDWFVEIDSRILTDAVNMSAKELTALLLHEAGHIVCSNSIPMRLAKVVRVQIAKSNVITKQLVKDTFFSKLLLFPILNACSMAKGEVDIKKEIAADKYVIKAGYGEDLVSAFDKIFVYAGSNTTADKDMEDMTAFSIDTLLSLEKRRNHTVRNNVSAVLSKIPSTIVQKMVAPLKSGLTASSVGGSITEAARDEFLDKRIQKITDDFYASEAFWSRTHKMKRIDPADIDYIGLEVNNIKSNDDKMMIVSYIYNKLDTIDYYLALIDSKNPKYIIPHSRESLVQMRKTLDNYRLAAINRKLPEIKYGVHIQFPEGYEG